MKRYPILEICARVEGHGIMHQMLRDQCRGFDDWQGLLEQAEKHGMSPLLRKHLLDSKSDVPSFATRSLSILYKRHQKQAEVRQKMLEEILLLFQNHQLTPILIKGAALCQDLYNDPGLRPMRDMDILFAPKEVSEAQELLKSAGFIQSSTPIPPDHYHLPPLNKSQNGMDLCIELHQGLYPDCPPYYPVVDFKKLFQDSRKLQIGKIAANTFSHEEMLHYLYQHGLHPPLTYETYKLINVADIIGYVEKYAKEIDWDVIRAQFPNLYRALPLMHHVSPWDLKKVPHTLVPKSGKKLQPIPFNGWPQRRMKELEKKVTRAEVLKKTYIPSKWWLGVYYGAGETWWRVIKAFCIDHPQNILWWTNVYSHFVIQTNPAAVSTDSTLGSLRLSAISNYNKVRGVIRKVFTV